MSKTLKTIWHNRIDSTNSEAKRLAEKGEDAPILIAANTQEKGRGRLGREWVSETGGCYFSLLITPKKKFGFEDISYQQQLIGQKLIHLLYEHTQVALTLEWPNDLILDNKKR